MGMVKGGKSDAETIHIRILDRRGGSETVFRGMNRRNGTRMGRGLKCGPVRNKSLRHSNAIPIIMGPIPIHRPELHAAYR